MIAAVLVTGCALYFGAPGLAFEARAWLMGAPHVYTDDEDIRAHELPVPSSVRHPSASNGALNLVYEILVDTQGRTVATTLKFDREKTSPALRAQVAQNLKQWRFRPFTKADGSPTPVRLWVSTGVLPPEKRPTRHVPFPETAGRPISIFLERTGCFGTCPAYVAILRNDGTVYFCGRYYVQAAGWREGRITREQFDTLVERFRKADFFSLDDEYFTEVTDNPTYLLGINVDGRSKVVLDYVGLEAGMPSAVTELQDAVDAAAGTTRWIGPQQEWGMGLPAAVQDCSTPPTPFSGSTPQS